MEQTLLTLGGLTLGGSAVVVLLALAGRWGKGRYGARWRCWGWLLLCLRLALPLPLPPPAKVPAPIQVELPAVTRPVPTVAVKPTAPPLPVQTAQPPQEHTPSTPPAAAVSTAPPPAASAAPEAPRPVRRPDPVRLLFTLWLVGVAGVLAWNAAAHLRFLRYLRRWAAPVTDGETISIFHSLGNRLSLPRRPRLLECRGLKVPMLAGTLRPTVLLPQEPMEDRALALSLLHELTHYRRRDVWRKVLAVWVNALYWFDPLMWWMVRLMERDGELACDEEALGRLPPEDRAAYGQTILNATARLQGGRQKGEAHD